MPISSPAGPTRITGQANEKSGLSPKRVRTFGGDYQKFR
jgi:hypothetical protein